MVKQAAAPGIFFGERLGLDYRRWTLDCVIPAAIAVAWNFSDQPEFYRQVDDATADALTDLQANYGFQADRPDTATRQRLMKPIFGESDGHGSGNDGSAFQTYRLPVLAAAAAFAESNPTQPNGFPALRKRVQTEIEAGFKPHMTKLQTASLSQTERRIGSIFDTARKILLSQGVGAKFGITGPINSDWPLESPIDPLGAQLIEQITTQLPDLPYGVIPLEMFVHIQQTAKDGFLSIRDIVDKNVEDPNFDIGQLDQVIAELYAWASDLRLIGVVPSQMRPPRMAPPLTVGTASKAARAWR